MRPNPIQERLSVPQILVGLTELENCLGFDPSSNLSPLFPFKVACSVREQVAQGPFGLDLAWETRPFRECLMFIAAAMDLVRYFQAARHKSELRKLRSHFALISHGFFGIAGTYSIQMSKGSLLRKYLPKLEVQQPTDAIPEDATRKTIELMLALAALNTFDGIEVEDPNTSDPADPNPDLIVRHQGKRIGIACKSTASRHEETFKDNVTKGISQLEHAIEAGKVDRRCGVVLLDVSAIVDQDKLFVPKAGHCWPYQGSGEVFMDAVTSALQSIFAPNLTRSYHDILRPIYKGHALPTGVLVYAHGLMLCSKDGVVSPVYQKGVRLIFGGDTSFLGRFGRRLNCALHCQAPRR
jgi:hypothetical protein